MASNRSSLAALSDKKIVQCEIRDISLREEDDKKLMKTVENSHKKSPGKVKDIINRFERGNKKIKLDEESKEKIVLRKKHVEEKKPNDLRGEDKNFVNGMKRWPRNGLKERGKTLGQHSEKSNLKSNFEFHEVQRDLPEASNFFLEQITKPLPTTIANSEINFNSFHKEEPYGVGGEEKENTLGQPSKCFNSITKSKNYKIQIDLPIEIKNANSICVAKQITKTVPTTPANFELNFNGFNKINSKSSNFGSFWENRANFDDNGNKTKSDNESVKIIIIPILLKAASFDHGNFGEKSSRDEEIADEDIPEILGLIKKSERRIKELSLAEGKNEKLDEDAVDEKINRGSGGADFGGVREQSPQREKLFEGSNEKENRSVVTTTSNTMSIGEDNAIFVSLIPGQHDMPENWNFGTGPQKTLWQEQPNVIKSGILHTIGNQELKLRESLFEIITSESSYAKGLKVLVDHLMAKIRARVSYAIDLIDYNSMFPTDIFENILKTTLPFLKEILTMFDNDVEMNKLCCCLRRNYVQNKSAYLVYFQHSKEITEKIRHVYSVNKKFKLLVDQLTVARGVSKLPLMSYVALPMQRITRLPLLMKNIISKADPESAEFMEYATILKTLTEIALDCNLEQDKVEKQDTMKMIAAELKFSDHCRREPISTASRIFLMRAVAYEVVAEIPKKEERHQILLYLFNDAIVIAKKNEKKRNLFWITDFCNRKALRFEVERNVAGTLLVLKMLINIRVKTDMRILFESEDDGKKFENLLSEKHEVEKTDNDITIVVVNKRNSASQDEMKLFVGDIINVSKKKAGRYFGKRIHDQVEGWFPESCCKELVSKNNE